MANKSFNRFLKIFAFLGAFFLGGCAHQASFQSSATNNEALIYNLLGTKAAFLNSYSFDLAGIADYEKQVQVEEILALPTENYKLWLEQTAKHFANRRKSDSLNRYIGRDLFFKASVLEKFGHLEKAEGLFSLLFQNFDVSEESLVHHAVLVLKLGNLEKARLSLLKAIEVASDFDRKVDLIQVWLNVTEAMGNKELVTSDFKLAMDTTKEHYTVCARYGKYLQENRQTAEALKLLNNCLPKQKNSTAQQVVSLEIAKIYVQKMEFPKAESILSRL